MSSNLLRKTIGYFAFFGSVAALLYFFGQQVLNNILIHLWPWVWCALWGLFGISIELLGTTKGGSKDIWHYIKYYSLVLFIATYIAYGGCFLDQTDLKATTWFRASFVAFIIGISGDSLFGILRKSAEKIHDHIS